MSNRTFLAQLKELEGFWETVTEPACPTRFTRSEQAKIQANSGTETAGTEDGDLASASGTVTEAAAVATEAAAVAAVDAYDLLEAVNVLAKLPADFYENVVSKVLNGVSDLFIIQLFIIKC